MSDPSAGAGATGGGGASTSASAQQQQQQQQQGDAIRNVPILLKTSIPGASIPLTPYLVPVSWRRTHLSTLVNRVLRTTSNDEAAATIPFDFIVDGQLLRNTSLGEYISRQGKDAEVTLELEYVRSNLPPRFENQIPQDDWVGSVDASRDGLFMTSSYDGTVRIFSHTSTATPLYSLKAAPTGTSNASLTHARWLPSSSASSSSANDDGPQRLVTAGMDGTIRLFEIPPNSLQLRAPLNGVAGENGEAIGGGSRKAKMLWSGSLHSSSSSSFSTSSSTAVQPVSSIFPSEDGKYVISAGWDGLVGLWGVDAASSDGGQAPLNGMDVDEFDTSIHRRADLEAEADEDSEADDGGDDRRARKRQKALGGKKTRAQASAAMGGTHKPELVLRHVAPLPVAAVAGGSVAGPGLVPGPNAKLSKAIFDGSQASKVYSAGWDGSIKAWDIENAGALLSHKPSDKVILDMTQLSYSSGDSSAGLLATGHMDRSLGFWDFRAGTTANSSIVLQTPNAHSGPVTGIAAHPISSHLLATSSMDGSVKGWDVRSSKQAIFSLTSPPPDARTKSGAAAAAGKGRLLCVDWMKDGQGIVAGGEDCRLSVWRGQGIGVEELKPVR